MPVRYHEGQSIIDQLAAIEPGQTVCYGVYYVMKHKREPVPKAPSELVRLLDSLQSSGRIMVFQRKRADGDKDCLAMGVDPKTVKLIESRVERIKS